MSVPRLLRIAPNDLFSQKRYRLRTDSTAAKPPCSGFSPDSLVQQNKNACPSVLPSGSRICHKISRVLFHRQKTVAFSLQCRPVPKGRHWGNHAAGRGSIRQYLYHRYTQGGSRTPKINKKVTVTYPKRAYYHRNHLDDKFLCTVVLPTRVSTKQVLPSQVAPMTGFRQRTCF